MSLPHIMLLAVLALGGCAQMTVNVSVLDRKYWSSPDELSSSISGQVANMARKRGNGEFARTQERIRSNAHAALFALVKAGVADESDIGKLMAPLDSAIDNAFQEANQHFAAAFQKLGSTLGAPKQDRSELLFAAQSELDAGYRSIRRLQDEMSAQLRTNIDAARRGIDSNKADAAVKRASVKAAEKATSQVNEAITGLIGDQGILDDPLAASVVYAPEIYWRRAEPPYGINETFATGNWGNTDIAIKMESVGNFTIKGVRLDASKITQATFAVGRQAVKTVAAVYGIPMPTGANDKSTAVPAAFAETPVTFSSPDQRVAGAQEALIRRRLARLTIFETIIIQRAALTNAATTDDANAGRAVAVKTVKDVFTANRAELDTPTDTK